MTVVDLLFYASVIGFYFVMFSWGKRVGEEKARKKIEEERRQLAFCLYDLIDDCDKEFEDSPERSDIAFYFRELMQMIMNYGNITNYFE